MPQQAPGKSCTSEDAPRMCLHMEAFSDSIAQQGLLQWPLPYPFPALSTIVAKTVGHIYSLFKTASGMLTAHNTICQHYPDQGARAA